MQIIIDTKDNPAHVAGAIALLQELFNIGDDNPAIGRIVDPVSIPKAPAAVSSAEPASFGARGVAAELPPNVDAAAAAFGTAGGAVVPIPPGVPQVSAPAAGPASAPAPTAGAPLAGANGVQIDSEGVPWDGRIHSTPPTINKSGEWRAKRGVNDEAMVNRIKAELRAVQALPQAPSFPVPPVPPAGEQPVAPVVPQPIPLPPGVPTAADLTLVPQPPAAPQPPAPPVPPVQITFQGFVAELTPLLQTGRLTHAELNAAMGQFGLASLGLLATRPDLVNGVRAAALALVRPAA